MNEQVEKISVFLSDWQVLFREGIHFTLSGEEDMEVIGETTSTQEAMATIEANPPRVAILNIDQDKLSGVEATRRLRQDFPSVAVILVMDKDEEDKLFQAMCSGAAACVTKDIDPDELVSTIRNVVNGHKPIINAIFRPGIASRVMSEFEALAGMGEELNRLLAHLSPKESTILGHIANGDTMPQLTQGLGMTEETIRHHLSIIQDKLCANEHHQEITAAAQDAIPASFSHNGYRGRLRGQATPDYVTKQEFEAFKESLRLRFKSFVAD
ncbi:MAG: response regulator transcription factor [Chloroflexota bacterium]